MEQNAVSDSAADDSDVVSQTSQPHPYVNALHIGDKWANYVPVLTVFSIINLLFSPFDRCTDTVPILLPFIDHRSIEYKVPPIRLSECMEQFSKVEVWLYAVYDEWWINIASKTQVFH